MIPFAPKTPDIEQVEQQAATWVLRQDRGLTATEQDEFLHWLASDSRHGTAIARHRRNWDRLNLLAEWRPEHGPRPNRDLLAPPPRPVFAWMKAHPAWLVPMGLAAALAVGVFFFGPRPARPVAAAPAVIATIEQRTLEDGSVIELNRGAEIAVLYTAGERRVRLERGEAHFTVAKNPERPFIVTAGGVDVRAVGTAFNVKLETEAVEVLVTEGVVQVNQPNSQPSALNSQSFHLSIGKRTSVPLAAVASLPEVVPVTPEQVETILAWQPRMLDFTDDPLSGIVSEFNRHNDPIRLVIADPGLGSTRVSATLRSDNVEGFIRLLEAGFGVQAERAGNTVTLRKNR